MQRGHGALKERAITSLARTPPGHALRVLHILDHSAPLHSGYAFRTLALLREQQSLGWEPYQLTGPKQGNVSALKEYVEGFAFDRTLPLRGPWAGVPIVKYWLLIQKLTRRLREVANEVQPDLIHAHSPVLNALPALRVGQERGLPVVYEIRAFWEDAAVDHGTTKEWGPRYRFSRALETRAARRTDAVTTICEGLRTDLIERGIPGERVTVIPNAVDVQRFSGSVSPDPELMREFDLRAGYTLGFVGSFYAYEGLDLLIRAMPKIIAALPAARLLCVGGGPQKRSLSRLTARLGLERAVRFTGRVPHDQIGRYYSAADVLVYPRVACRLTELVTPLKPLEAMASGKVVIASDVGGHRELIMDGSNGYLFPAGSVEALSNRVIEVMKDQDSWRPLLVRARDYVETERNWHLSVARYHDVYRDALLRAGERGSCSDGG